MKVLLTGASGFVGSHILESLAARQIPTTVLLRNPARKPLFLSGADTRTGSVEDLDSLRAATHGVTHVIHCAGRTKAVRPAEFYQTNEGGTRHLVDAINARGAAIERLVHISSLAVCGPATPDAPAREDAPNRPVSDYGKSKLAAETQVRERCRVPFTIIRPPAVYGPRDTGFFSIFKAVNWHISPRAAARQALSLVYAKDLAQAVTTCLLSPSAAGKTYFVADRAIVTARSIAEEIARQMRRWTLPLPLHPALLWVSCLLQEGIARITGRPSLLNLQKYAELRAPGWVCSPAKIQAELGVVCPTSLQQGIGETLAWYRQERWL